MVPSSGQFPFHVIWERGIGNTEASTGRNKSHTGARLSLGVWDTIMCRCSKAAHVALVASGLFCGSRQAWVVILYLWCAIQASQEPVWWAGKWLAADGRPAESEEGE
jgi:hypothetical protein